MITLSGTNLVSYLNIISWLQRRVQNGRYIMYQTVMVRRMYRTMYLNLFPSAGVGLMVHSLLVFMHLSILVNFGARTITLSVNFST